MSYEKKVRSDKAIKREALLYKVPQNVRLQHVLFQRKQRSKKLNEYHAVLKDFQKMVDAIVREVERRKTIERNANELIAADSSKPRKKAKPKRISQKKPHPKDRPLQKQETIPAQIERLPAREPFSQSFDTMLIQRNQPYKLASRVRRWQRARPETIRTFVDSGQKLYAKIEDDKEILLHRRDHNTSGLEYIFCDDADRCKYIFQTSTALGLMACMRMGWGCWSTNCIV